MFADFLEWEDVGEHREEPRHRVEVGVVPAYKRSAGSTAAAGHTAVYRIRDSPHASHAGCDKAARRMGLFRVLGHARWLG